MNTFIQWHETISDADTPPCFPFIEPNTYLSFPKQASQAYQATLWF